jgi:Flp pilus assembly protein TadG
MKDALLRDDGAALVEFAIVATLLFTLFFAVFEFGLIFKDNILVGQAAANGARVASLGAATSTIQSNVTSVGQLQPANMSIALDYQTMDSAGKLSAWSTLTNSGSQNAAPSGSQVRVTLNYTHPLVMGALFSNAFGSSTSTNLKGVVIERRL